MSHIVVITGTRRETRRGVISRELDRLKPTHAILGDCPTGVDAEALAWCKANGCKPIVCVALWDWFRAHGDPREAGPQRNVVMAHVGKCMGAVECLAVPDDDSLGTHQCAAACTRWGVPARYLRP